MGECIILDDREVRERMAKLATLNGKKLSVIAWKVGKEAMFGILKATPVAKSMKLYQLRDKTGKPITNRSGEMVWMKNPKRFDKKAVGKREGYESSRNGRRYTKIPTGKRFLLSSWYTARMGFKIKTGNVGRGSKAAGEFLSGDSKYSTQLIFSNLVPYADKVDKRTGFVAAGIGKAQQYLEKAIQAEIDKITGLN